MSPAEILENFKVLYCKLAAEIQRAYVMAEKNNQQLLISIGGYHEGIASLAVELMVVLIAQSYGINNAFLELNKHMLGYLRRHGHVPIPYLVRQFEKDRWSTTDILYNQVASLKLNMNFFAVDLGLWGAKKIGDQFDDYEEERNECVDSLYNSTTEGIQYRDQVIHEVSIGYCKQHSILMVGAEHLDGLLRLRKFPAHILVLAMVCDINFIRQVNKGRKGAYKKRLDYCLNSPDLLKVTKDFETAISSLKPEIAVEYIMQAHQQLQSTSVQQLILTQAVQAKPPKITYSIDDDEQGYGLDKLGL